MVAINSSGNLGDRVRATRAVQGPPIDQAARGCSVSAALLSKLENGKSVNFDYVLRALEGLGLTILAVPRDHVPLLEQAAAHAVREARATAKGALKHDWD